MNPRKIVVDGKTYRSVEEMPPEVRRQFEEAMQALGDANGNLIPDVLEGAGLLADRDRDGLPDLLQEAETETHVVTQMKIVVDGQEFESVESLPPEARARYEEAMSRLAKAQAGPQARAAAEIAPGPGTKATGVRARDLKTPDTSGGGLLVMTGLLVLLLCIAGAGAVWYFFLR